MTSPKLPAGETLPEYDDQHPEGVDVAVLHRWLVANRHWGGVVGRGYPAVSDVLVALQAVGDATLVKNGTYRMLRRDAADVERLAAQLSRAGHSALLVEHGGNPVTAAVALLNALDVTA